MSAKGNRFVALDGLRGIGALLVVLAHVRIQELFWTTTWMDMFFVMSAFMIGRLVFMKARDYAGLMAFYRRRIERLWPLYMLTVFAVFAGDAFLALLSSGSEISVGSLWRYVSFSQYSELLWGDEYLFPYPAAALHTWSLAVEEQFYIFFPLLFGLCLLVREQLIVPILLVLGGLGIFLRLEGSSYYVLTFHIDAFCWGVLLAYSYPKMVQHPALATRIFLGLVAVGSVGYVGYLWEGYAQYAMSPDTFPPPAAELSRSWLHWVILFWVGLIGLMVVHPLARCWAPFRWRIPALLGLMSYALYLVHVPIIVAFQKIFQSVLSEPLTEWSVAAVRLMSLPLVFLCAYLMYRFIDRPLQQRGSGFITTRDAS